MLLRQRQEIQEVPRRGSVAAALIDRLQPYIQRASAFSGWDFSFIESTTVGSPLPWNYEVLARQHAAAARRVLDLGTGGGEVLSRIATGQAASLVATEQWHVNAPVAYERLQPLGMPVVRARSDAHLLPFRDDAFDLVLSRHEAIEPVEVDRIVAPGGIVLTQQVMADNWPELTAFFPRKTIFPDHFAAYHNAFVSLGYTVRMQQHNMKTAYRSLGDLVVMLLIAKDYIPDFDIERDAEALLAVESALGTPEGIVLTEPRYLLEARKPLAP